MCLLGRTQEIRFRWINETAARTRHIPESHQAAQVTVQSHSRLDLSPSVCVCFYVFVCGRGPVWAKCVFNIYRVAPTGQAMCEDYESPMTALVGVEPATLFTLRGESVIRKKGVCTQSVVQVQRHREAFISPFLCRGRWEAGPD